MTDTSDDKKAKVRPEILISLFLIISTLAVYWQVRRYDFINFDDLQYVIENPIIQEGISSDGILQAFTKKHAGFWIPVTWLSLMLDYQLYGLNPGQFHITNLLIHIANTLLLFFLLKKMTGAVWQSAYAAALFALHPLHVESVAWVTERKDMLSMLFFLLSLSSYLRYIRHPKLISYLPILLWFVLGLMSKPMIVTLPCVLLLTDFWPLSRYPSVKPKHLLAEKIPLFAISVLFGIITILTQKHAGAVIELTRYPVSLRIANAAVSYVIYLWKTICPVHLAVFYPLRSHIPLWETGSALLFILVVSVSLFKKSEKYPFLSVGWLWYIGTLVPVIGIVQSGTQAMADRFTYIPLIGIFIIISWGMPYLIKQKFLLKIAAYSFLSLCAIFTYFQVQHWQNTITLFEHAVNVTENNLVGYNNLGDRYENRGDFKRAAYYFSKAVQIAPNDARIHYKLGTMRMRVGDIEQAAKHFADAVRMMPDDADAHNDLGVTLIQMGKIADAVRHFSIALGIRPDDSEIRNNLNQASSMLIRTKPDNE